MRAILLAGGISLLISLIGTRYAIRQFTKMGYGQEVRDDGPTTHHVKRGTPTMGGVVLIGASVIGYFAAKIITVSTPSASALLLLLLFVGTGLVGFLDDFIKIYKQRSLGLRSKAKIVGQTVVGLAFGILALSPLLEDDRGQRPASFSLSFIRDFDSFVLPAVVVVALILLMVIATSNATNLTDGADGLLTGCSVMVFGAYTIVNIWQNNQWCRLDDITYGKCYEVRDPLDLAVIADAQSDLWFVVWMPVAFLAYLVGVLGFALHGPLAAPVGDEMAGGVLAELSGPDLLVARAGRHALLGAGAAVAVPLFLGGGSGPWLPDPVWVAVKAIVLTALLSYAAGRLPRLRVPLLLGPAWVVLLPLVVLQDLVVGVVLL